MLNLERTASSTKVSAQLAQDGDVSLDHVSGPLAQGREFVWSNRDFARVQALIYKHARHQSA